MKTLFLRLLVLLPLLAVPPLAPADDVPGSQQALQELAGRLYERLAGAVSFEARYTLTKPQKTGHLRLIYNAAGAYWLLLGDLDDSGKEQLFSWLDLEKRQLYQQTASGAMEKLDLGKLFDTGNDANPWNRLLQGLPATPGLEPLRLALLPTLQLEWQGEGLALGMGVEFSRLPEQAMDKNPLRVSWLSGETLAQVKEVRDLSETYLLVMPEQRLLAIDKRFGLLQSDVRLGGNKGEFNISIEKLKPLKGNPPVSKFYPDLAKLTVSEPDNLAMGQLYFSGFVLQALSLQRQGVAMEQVIGSNLPDFAEYAGDLAMRYWIPVFRQRLEAKLMQQEFQDLRSSVIDEYRKFVLLRNDSSMSLSDFIDHTRIAQTMVEQMSPTPLETRVTLPPHMDLGDATPEFKGVLTAAWQSWHDADRFGQVAAVVNVVLDALRQEGNVHNPLQKN